jgi:ubiquinone/menaquinone biosynthesis C-methylase UbiE
MSLNPEPIERGMNTKYPQYDRCKTKGSVTVYSHAVKTKRTNAVRMFDFLSPFYDVLISTVSRILKGRSYEGLLRREILSQLDYQQGHRLLEVGIGTGINVLYLEPRPESVVGVDPAKGMLRQCARRLRKWGIQGELFCHSGEELCFADNQYDRVFCLGVLEYAPSCSCVVKEMLRVLKPTGKLVLGVGTDWLSKHEQQLFQGMDLDIQITKPAQCPTPITVMTIQHRAN